MMISRYNGLINLRRNAPRITDGTAAGTNQRTISQRIFLKKSHTRESDEKVVPIERAAGSLEAGRYNPITGISRRPAPPPQTALNEKAIIAVTNMIMSSIMSLNSLNGRIWRPILNNLCSVPDNFRVTGHYPYFADKYHSLAERFPQNNGRK